MFMNVIVLAHENSQTLTVQNGHTALKIIGADGLEIELRLLPFADVSSAV